MRARGAICPEDWRVEEENGTVRELGSAFYSLSGEPRLLRARTDKLPPGLHLRAVVAFAYETNHPIGDSRVLVYDDDGVAD